jgi:undecaprenyl-diphosphatase
VSVPPVTHGRPGWLAEAQRIDEAVYAAVAGTESPILDRVMRRLSRAADYSRLSLAASTFLAATGRDSGRRAAVSGLASVAATATFINLVVKPAGGRRRPDRGAQGVPVSRQVRLPESASFPSGHTAAAVAFASGAARELPPLGLPLHLLAAAVGYSRVHTGVHYPGDVIGGALLGAGIAELVTARFNRTWPTRRSS